MDLIIVAMNGYSTLSILKPYHQIQFNLIPTTHGYKIIKIKLLIPTIIPGLQQKILIQRFYYSTEYDTHWVIYILFIIVNI